MAGQSVALVSGEQSVGEIIEELVDQAASAIGRIFAANGRAREATANEFRRELEVGG